MNTAQLIQYLPFLIPLIVLELGLAVAALVHVLRHKHYRFGNRVVWVIVVLLFQFVGPLVYFIAGRGDD